MKRKLDIRKLWNAWKNFWGTWRIGCNLLLTLLSPALFILGALFCGWIFGCFLFVFITLPSDGLNWRYMEYAELLGTATLGIYIIGNIRDRLIEFIVEPLNKLRYAAGRKNNEDNYSFLDRAYLFDLDPKNLSLESLFKFKAALMHKLIYVNAEERRRLIVLAESAKESPTSQKEFIIFADGLARVSALDASLIPELEHMLKS